MIGIENRSQKLPGATMSEINDDNPLKQLLDAIISSLEPLEARSEAIYQFLKVKSGASDQDIAPFLEQAANASNVRWRAFRVRAESLIEGAMKERGKESKVEQSEPVSELQKPQAAESEKVDSQKGTDDAKSTQAKGQTEETVAVKNPARNDAEPAADDSKSQKREGPIPSGTQDQARDQPSHPAASKPEAQQKNPSVQEGGPDEPVARGKSTAQEPPKDAQSTAGPPRRDAPKKSAA